MPSQYDTLTSFFEKYERASNAGDIDAVVAMFADPFTVAAQQGPQIVRVGDFTGVIRKRKILFDKLGHQEATLDSLKTTPLNDHFALVDTTWRMRFLLPDGKPDTFVVASSFLVYLEGAGAKIFVYMAHDDIMKILSDRGILTAA